MEFEVFDAEDRPIVRLTVKGSSATAVRSAMPVLSEARHLAPDVVHLLQHLLQLEV